MKRVLKPGEPVRPLRVGGYARVSTLNQVREHDSSVDTQITRITKRVEYETEQASHEEGGRPWQLVDTYREEGRSGKNTDRPELQRLLADVRAGKLDVVVVTKIDRITRSLIDFYDLWHTFDEHGVEFVALDDRFETATATGRAMLKLTLVFAELERERTSERTKEKVQARRAAGMWFGGTVPFGYTPHPSDRTSLKADGPTAKLLREEFFERFLELGSARALVRHLDRRGIARPSRKNKHGAEREGRSFGIQAVLDMLSSRVYIAERELDDGAIVRCNWEPIIERSLFDRVQAKLAENSVDRPTGRIAQGHVYLLEDVLRCGRCGAAMTRATGTSRNGATYFYYRCGNKHRSASTRCSTRDLPVDAVERFVIDEVKKLAVDPVAVTRAVREANAGRDRELAKVEGELAKVTAALGTATKAVTGLVDAVERDSVENGGRGGQGLRARLREREATAQVLRVEADDLALRRDALRQKMLDAEVVCDGYRRLPAILDGALRRGELEELKQLIQALVEIVEWCEDAEDPTRGSAAIELYELPRALVRALEARQEEQPGEPLSGGSPGCQEWLPSVDSNHGQAD